MQSLNEHGNQGVEQIAESFGVVCHQLRPRTIALNLNLAEAGLMQSLNQHGNQ
jgi:hypothetical protein